VQRPGRPTKRLAGRGRSPGLERVLAEGGRRARCPLPRSPRCRGGTPLEPGLAGLQVEERAAVGAPPGGTCRARGTSLPRRRYPSAEFTLHAALSPPSHFQRVVFPSVGPDLTDCLALGTFTLRRNPCPVDHKRPPSTLVAVPASILSEGASLRYPLYGWIYSSDRCNPIGGQGPGNRRRTPKRPPAPCCC